MRPEYQDFFMKEVRFMFMCGGPGGCGAAVIPGTQDVHTEWHLTLEGKSNDTRGTQPEG